MGGAAHMVRSRAELPGAGARARQNLRRLVLPTVALLGVFALAYEGWQRPVVWPAVFGPEQQPFHPGPWLTYGHLVLPGLFFILNLTNRRYGPGVTLSAVMLSWGLIIAGLSWALWAYGLAPVQDRLGLAPIMASFAGSLFAGELVAIYIFDRVRGVPWWRAPLYGFWLGGTAFLGFFHWPEAMRNTGSWAGQLLVEFGIYTGWAVVSLLVYHALRRMVRPLPGFGGA